MAYGVVTPTVPLATDIVLGEAKLYSNYELPNQLELGALKGGVKLDITRKIKEVNADGFYGTMLDTAGNPLLRYDSFTVKLTAEMLSLKYENRVIVSDMESDETGWASTDWAAGGGTYAAESTIVLEGDQSAKMSSDTDTYGIKNVFSSAMDLTVFNNGESVTDSDYICFSIYATTQDIADMDNDGLRLYFHSNAAGALTHGWYYDIDDSVLTADAWTVFKVARSSFTELGTGDWSTIYGVSLVINGSPSANVDAYIDTISILQNTNKSTVVPVNGGANFSYTDEGDYREITPTLEITDDEYFENVAIVANRLDGKLFVCIIKNVCNDGSISQALKEKDEVVNNTVFTAHYKRSAPTTVPILIRHYDS
jgi:hypothetical protein